MTELNCRELDEQYDLFKDPLCPPDTRARVSRHIDTCPVCAERYRRFDQTATALSNWQPEADCALDDRRIIVKVLQKLDEPKALAEKPAHPWFRPAVIAAAVLLVAAGGLLFYAQSAPESPEESPAIAFNAAPITTTADGRIQMRISQNTDVWMTPRTGATIEKQSESEVVLKLRSGTVLVNIKKHPPGYRFVVRTPRGTVEAIGTIFSVEVSADGAETTRVLRGTVAAAEKNRTVLIHADQEFIGGSTAPVALNDTDRQAANCLMGNCNNAAVAAAAAPENSEPLSDKLNDSVAPQVEPAPENAAPLKRPIDEDALVSRAVALRNEGNPEGAAKVYKELIEGSPSSEVSATSRVSIGYLMLRELNNPAQARRWFRDYLGRWPDGAMAEEARLGVVRALQKQNNPGETIAASREFASRHPTAFALNEVQLAQADAHRSLNQCEEAILLYNRLLTASSGSIRENAKRGIAGCASAPQSE